MLLRNVPESLRLHLSKEAWVGIFARVHHHLNLRVFGRLLTNTALLLHTEFIFLFPAADLGLRPVTNNIALPLTAASVREMLLVNGILL